MAERARAEAQRARESAREGRRRLAPEPFEALGSNDDDGEQGNGERPLAAARLAARTAAAAAVAGGLAGAAKALVERRRIQQDEENDERVEPAAEETADPSDEAADRARGDDSGADESDSGGPDVEEDEQPEQSEQSEQSAAAEPGIPSASDEEPRQGGTSSEVADVVERARGHVAGLLDKEPETVSGISRGNGSWTVTVEVVDVHRIPDSTDILSSYDVVLDDDGGLLRLERRGRYRRAQIEEGR